MARKSEETTSSVLAGCMGILLLIPIAALSQAWSMATLWGWFVVPLGAPNISALHAYGLCLLISGFRGRAAAAQSEKKSTSETVAGLIAASIAAPLVAVLMGWLALRCLGPLPEVMR